MKTLKKVLALTLASTMSLSMLAGAAFTDADSISADATDAVDNMVALSIIQGYPDGSFGPEKVVTRAEMAKMIYTLYNGGQTDASFWETSIQNPFVDMGNAEWAIGYVNFCYANGIIAGKGYGVFDPNAPVTVVEAAKMMLTVAGYQADKAGLVGPSWALSTAELATVEGILDDVNTGAATEGALREIVAIMLNNLLSVDTVEYSKDIDAFVKDEVKGAPVSVGYKFLDLVEFEGVYMGNGDYSYGGNVKDGEIRIEMGGEDQDESETFAYDMDLSMIGEEVVVLYQDKDGSGYDIKDDRVYGVRLSGDTTAHSVIKADLDIEMNDANTEVNNIEIDGTDYKPATNDADKEYVQVITNYDDNDTYMTETQASAEYIKGTFDVNSADQVKLIENEDGDIATIFVTERMYDQVVDVLDDEVQFATIGNQDLDDVVAYEGMDDEDIVVYSKLFGDTYVVEKADIVEGEMTALKGADEIEINDETFYKRNLEVDSITYTSTNPATTFSVKTSVVETVEDYDLATTGANPAVEDSDVGIDYNVIVDGGLWVAAMASDDAIKNYAVITSGADGVNDQIKLYQADGASVVYDLDDSDGVYNTWGTGDADDAELALNTLVEYSTKDDGDTAEIEKDSVRDDAVISKYDEDAKTFTLDTTVANSAMPVATDAVAFVYAEDDKEWGVYKVTDLATIDGIDEYDHDLDKGVLTADEPTISTYIEEDGIVKAFAIYAESAPSAAGKETVYGYVTGDGTYTNGSNTEYTVWTAEGEVELVIDGNTVGTIVDGDYVVYDAVEDGEVSKSKVTAYSINGSDVVSGNASTAIGSRTIANNAEIIAIKDTASTYITQWGGTAYTADADTLVVGVEVAETAKGANSYRKADTSEATVAGVTTTTATKNAIVIFENKTGYELAKAVFVDKNDDINGDSANLTVDVADATQAVVDAKNIVAGLPTHATTGLPAGTEVLTAAGVTYIQDTLVINSTNYTDYDSAAKAMAEIALANANYVTNVIYTIAATSATEVTIGTAKYTVAATNAQDVDGTAAVDVVFEATADKVADADGTITITAKVGSTTIDTATITVTDTDDNTIIPATVTLTIPADVTGDVTITIA